MVAEEGSSGPEVPDGFCSGFVALAGRPNVGKSTLLNRLVGERVAITAHRAQTTRKRIRGMVNRESCQIIFVDTPGLHLPLRTKDPTGQPKGALSQYMLSEAHAALSEVDLAVLLIEAQGRGQAPDLEEEDRMVLKAIRFARCRCLLAINKIDLMKKKQQLLPMMDAYQGTGLFAELIPLSAKTGEGVDRLLSAIEAYLPEGPRYFPPDMVTDEPERLLVAEYIREQVFLQASQEIPYSTAVEVISFEEISDRQLVHIHALIFVERKSQKGILIGKGGQRLRSIGTEARRSIERLLGCKVYLDLRIKLSSGWSKTKAGLRKVGYRES